QFCQGLLRINIMLGHVRLECLQIDSQCSAFGTSTGQPEYDTRPVSKQYPDSLRGTNTTIDGIGIAKIVTIFDLVCAERLILERREPLAKMIHDTVRSRGIQTFIIVSGVIIAAKSRPMSLQQHSDWLSLYSQDV